MVKTKVVCIGDSITWGFPFGPEYSWVRLTSQELDIPMINRGINGETAEDLLCRFGGDALAGSPSHVVIMVGTNDASIGVTLESYSRDMVKMLNLAAENKIIPVLGLPVPSDDRLLENTLTKYRRWLKDYGTTCNITSVDFSPAMLTPDRRFNRRFYLDEVHPNKEGYRSMASLMVEFWRKNLLNNQ